MRMSIQITLCMLLIFNTNAMLGQVKGIEDFQADSMHNVKNTASVPLENEDVTTKSINHLPFMPLTDAKVSSGFGWRKHPNTRKYDFHQGVDLIAKDKVVRNILDGKVTHTGYHKNLGNYVRVDHGAVESIYGHLSIILVKVSQGLSSGYPIGITGSTGRVTGEHLHFGVMFNGVYINPWHFLQSLINYTTQYNSLLWIDYLISRTFLLKN